MTFGQWIKERREELGLSAAECAGRIGMTPSGWSRYETGETRRRNGEPSKPRPETVEAIAKALEVPVSLAMSKAYPIDEPVDPGLGAYIANKEKLLPESKRSRYRDAVRKQADLLFTVMDS